MITKDAALQDLEVLVAEAKDNNTKIVVKAVMVLVKFLSTMRSNQLLTEQDRVAIKTQKEENRKKEVK